jgi:hypothetical protein
MLNFGNLVHLFHLYLRDNQLTHLPESIENLTSLHTLDISRNNLVKLPDNIGNLSYLYNLDISYNKISELSASFDSLNVRKLIIKRNPGLKMSDKQKTVTKYTRKRERIYTYEDTILCIPL